MRSMMAVALAILVKDTVICSELQDTQLSGRFMGLGSIDEH
jgi:hypothetical protein